MTTTDQDWYGQIAEKAGVDADTVQRTLTRLRIPGKRPMVARRRLRLDGVHFAGVKNVTISDDSTERANVPFTFTHQYRHRLTAFATTSRNDAGKTTVVNVTEWGLRGGAGTLQADAKAWIRQAIVGYTISGERLLVAWTLSDGVSNGTVLSLGASTELEWDTLDTVALPAVETGDTIIASTVTALIRDGAEVLGRFETDKEFADVMSEVMGPRVGFEDIVIWQNNANAIDEEDGGLAPHGWPLWSQGLMISDSTKKDVVVLGETKFATVAVLSMYLGTPWGAASTATSAQKKRISAKLAGLTRRSRQDTAAREGSAAELETQLQTRVTELEKLPETDTLERVQRQLNDTRTAGAALETAERRVTETATARDEYQKQLIAAKADLLAVQEATSTRRFWHSLTPTCCPRCDTKVDQTKMLRETNGHCSLCDSELHDEPVITDDGPQDDDDQEPDNLTAMQDRVETLELEVATAEAAHTTAVEERTLARAEYNAAAADAAPNTDTSERRRTLELEIATLRGRLSERVVDAPGSPEVGALQADLDVLAAAHDIANTWKLGDQASLLAEVSDQIAEIARRLGISQLQSAALKSNANLEIKKGGEETNFGSVNPGEQLRLKIAVVVALLRVGGAAGVSRHPGVLFIDSFAREEMSDENAISTLRALQSVAEDFDIQIVTSSANGHLLQKELPAGAVRMATAPRDFMW